MFDRSWGFILNIIVDAGSTKYFYIVLVLQAKKSVYTKNEPKTQSGLKSGLEIL